ncbi:MAG: ABC transporter permease, partial [Aestuariivita sp.]|nr:ABC transporter permease [Aestuariivita sp.]
MNTRAMVTIYRNEMLRFFRTLTQSFLSPVVSTSLYFVVFGAAIGNQMEAMQGTDYGAFIVPGLVMLSVMTQSISAASFGIYFPKFIRTTYELLSAPISVFEIVCGFVSASVTKALIVGIFILLLAELIFDYR